MKTQLTQARLKELAHYDPATGIFTGISIFKHDKGYLMTRIDGRNQYLHRLAVLYMTGKFPPQDTDHANGIRDDNRWLNIKPKTYSENQQNRGGPQKNNKTGFLGVRMYGGRFMAKIRVNRKDHYLGMYGTPEEAHVAYMAAKRVLHTNSPRLLGEQS